MKTSGASFWISEVRGHHEVSSDQWPLVQQQRKPDDLASLISKSDFPGQIKNYSLKQKLKELLLDVTHHIVNITVVCRFIRQSTFCRRFLD